ncbi:branched-chain amino acid ABC transporter permease [Rubellimicrobium arenae]|uniref:branched-chain amino acid ABC transporter permease n=1 Tax=Rubellimicrobium arenae TaxID=2817372 RepID=UPI001B305782|nr:branched-chain amino acid ABC transporter permease [Rubellimicrobium arenae]
MGTLLQQTVNALSLGGVYALLALGLATVFSIVRLINFAHGEVMTIAGYGIWWALLLALPAPVAILAGVAVAVGAALAMERIAFRPMRGADVTTLLITSFAVSEIIKVLFQNGISARPVPIVLPAWLTSTIDLGAVRIGMISVVSIAAVVLALGAMALLLRRTPLGLAMRAAAEDFAVVRLMGIKANHVVALAFAISGALAGIAAVLWVAQRGSVDPLMGATPVLKAFIATVLGGLGSLGGAVLGGFVVGAVEVFLQGFLPEAALPYREAISLSIIIGLLVLRPDGLWPAANVSRS